MAADTNCRFWHKIHIIENISLEMKNSSMNPLELFLILCSVIFICHLNCFNDSKFDRLNCKFSVILDQCHWGFLPPIPLAAKLRMDLEVILLP